MKRKKADIKTSQTNTFSASSVGTTLIKINSKKIPLIAPIHVPMGEVHPGHIHPVLDEFQEDLRAAAGGPDGADYPGQSHPGKVVL